MNIRMVNQVVEWESRIQMENEKQANLKPKAPVLFPSSGRVNGKGSQSILSRIFNHSLRRNLSANTSKPA